VGVVLDTVTTLSQLTVTFAFSAGPGFDTASFREQAGRKIIRQIENKASGRSALSILMAVPPKGDFVLPDRFGKRREVESIMLSLDTLPKIQ
jgi:hypothetical protein